MLFPVQLKFQLFWTMIFGKEGWDAGEFNFYSIFWNLRIFLKKLFWFLSLKKKFTSKFLSCTPLNKKRFTILTRAKGELKNMLKELQKCFLMATLWHTRISLKKLLKNSSPCHFFSSREIILNWEAPKIHLGNCWHTIYEVVLCLFSQNCFRLFSPRRWWAEVPHRKSDFSYFLFQHSRENDTEIALK